MYHNNQVTKVLNAVMQELQLAKFPTKMADCQPKMNFPELETIALVLLENVSQNQYASMRLRLSVLNNSRAGKSEACCAQIT